MWRVQSWLPCAAGAAKRGNEMEYGFCTLDRNLIICNSIGLQNTFGLFFLFKYLRSTKYESSKLKTQGTKDT
jgi:hypothetical protein